MFLSATVVIGLMLFVQQPPAAVPQGDRERAHALHQEGWSLWNKQQLADAEAKFAEAVELDPAHAGAWNGLGWCRFNQGRKAEAVEPFMKCVELGGEAAPAARNGLGWIRWQEGDINGAEEHWSKATDAPACWLGLAQVYLIQGKWDDAAKWAEKASSTPGMGGEFAKELLEAARNRELTDELRARVMPQKQSPEGEDGWRLFQQGKFDDALAAFEMALDANPDDHHARNGRAWCLLNTGNAEEARAEFQILLDHNPRHPAALNGMAVILKNEGKVDEAIELWKKMQVAAPGANAGAWGLATTYFEQGDYEKALPYLEMINKQQPDQPQITEMLERAREELKK